MAAVAIKFTLSPQGQKVSLLAGGSGASDQTIEVGQGDPLFARALALADMDKHGNAVWDQTFIHWIRGRKLYDHVPTAQELIEAAETAEAREKDEQRRKQAAIAEEAMAVLRSRKTRTAREDYVCVGSGQASYSTLMPAWPHLAPAGVVESEEAREWQKELDAINERAKAQAESAARLIDEANIEAKKERERKAQERRDRLGLKDGQEAYLMDGSSLMNAPVWERHSRGNNWMAKITPDANAPGGLKRSFFAKDRGDGLYIVGEIDPGTPLEFAADYYSGSGKKSAERWYGYVVRTHQDDDKKYMILQECDSGKAAYKEGMAFQKAAVAS